MKRNNTSDEVIQAILKKVEMAESQIYTPKIEYDFSIDLNRFYLEALKIAFEYAIYKLGTDYLKDSRAKEIQQQLKYAIDGKMIKDSLIIKGVSFTPIQLQEVIKLAKGYYFHMLMLHTDAENNLIAEVILFMNPALSFCVLMSENANGFNFDFNDATEIIEL